MNLNMLSNVMVFFLHESEHIFNQVLLLNLTTALQYWYLNLVYDCMYNNNINIYINRMKNDNFSLILFCFRNGDNCSNGNFSRGK